jgi:hypothetical protein
MGITSNIFGLLVNIIDIPSPNKKTTSLCPNVIFPPLIVTFKRTLSRR